MLAIRWCIMQFRSIYAISMKLISLLLFLWFCLQCWDACQLEHSLGHSWSFWKKSSFEWVKWCKLVLPPLLFNFFFLSTPYDIVPSLSFVYVPLLVTIFTICIGLVTIFTIYYSYTGVCSLLEIKLLMHFLKAWKSLLVLERLWNSENQDLQWLLWLNKQKQSQVLPFEKNNFSLLWS